jgi:arylsulfatase A-like enzyme/Flp pilus assembly protein TadD
VVLVSIDTLRADHLPSYGYAGVETPHLDRFRRDAVLFTNAWSPCPMTLPAHTTMLTGLLPPEHGVRNNAGFTFDGRAHRSLPAMLSERGYATGAAVSAYVLRRETGLGSLFDFYEDSLDAPRGQEFSEMQRAGGVTARRAQPWIAARATKPFFFLFHIYEPHVPYEPPEPYRSRYASPYDGEIAAADAIVGGFLDDLRAAGVYDRAVVIVTSDHGEGLGDHGEDQHSILLYVEALRVPLLLKLPGSRFAGRTVTAPAGLVDIVPTVADLLGFERPRASSGVSLRSLAEGAAPSRTLYAETLYPRLQLGWSDLASATDGRWHYIRSPRPELYDLSTDPRERQDLVGREPARATALASELARQPRADASPSAVDPAVAERLAALGYIGDVRARRSEGLANPVDSLRLLGPLREGFDLAHRRRYVEAARALRAIVRTAPAMTEAWIRLGEVLMELGRANDAADAFDQGLAQSQVDLPDIVLARGYAHLRAGKTGEAERDAERAAPVLPAGASELRARLALARNRPDEAERYAREAMRARPAPSADLLLAEIFVRKGDLAAARRALDDAARRAADLELGRVPRLEFLRADLLAREGQLAGAETAYRREIEAFPGNVLAYANLAALYFAEGKKKESEATLEELVRANPHPQAYAAGAAALEAFGQREQAARWRRRAADPLTTSPILSERPE